MPNVLQMTRVLAEQPVIPVVPGVQIRNIRIPDDVERWLELRRRAFAGQRIGVRERSREDFAVEFLGKSWWRPEATWLAETDGLVGSVTLARRESRSEAKPVVHWLMVDPSQRRRGIGRLLMTTLEAVIWDEGGRQIWLETHSTWEEAVALYRAVGYVEVQPV